MKLMRFGVTGDTGNALLALVHGHQYDHDRSPLPNSSVALPVQIVQGLGSYSTMRS